MKQVLLATVLILAPVGLFAGAYRLLASAPPPVPPVASARLGDLAPFQSIVADVAALVATGDLPAAEARATDFETLWDQDEAAMRPLDGAAWGAIDDAADALFHSLRSSPPDAAAAASAASALSAVLAAPPDAGAAGGVTLVGSVAVTDASGHPLSCEAMLKDLRDRLAAAPPAGDVLAQVTDLQSRATERCNADDDARADAFTAQALALLGP